MNITRQTGSGCGITSLPGSRTFSLLSDSSPLVLSVLRSPWENVDFSQASVFFFSALAPEEVLVPFAFPMDAGWKLFWIWVSARKLGLLGDNGDVRWEEEERQQ